MYSYRFLERYQPLIGGSDRDGLWRSLPAKPDDRTGRSPSPSHAFNGGCSICFGTSSLKGALKATTDRASYELLFIRPFSKSFFTFEHLVGQSQRLIAAKCWIFSHQFANKGSSSTMLLHMVGIASLVNHDSSPCLIYAMIFVAKLLDIFRATERLHQRNFTRTATCLGVATSSRISPNPISFAILHLKTTTPRRGRSLSWAQRLLNTVVVGGRSSFP